MSKHKKQKQKKHFLRKRNIFIIVLIVLSSCSISFLIYKMNNPTDIILNPKEAVVKADELRFAGNYTKAIAVLDASFNNTNDTKDKSMILQQKASLLINKEDLINATNTAKEAYNLDKTVSSASVVGMIAKDCGDIETAKKYYQIALDLENKSPNPFGTSDRDYLQNTLKDLDNGY